MDRTGFTSFLKDLEAEAEREGPDAVQENRALGQHFELAREVARLRKSMNLTQVQLAQRAGLQQSEVSRIERGEGNPTIKTITSVLGALGARLTVTSPDLRRPRKRSSRSRGRATGP